VDLPKQKVVSAFRLRSGEAFLAAGGFEERATRFSEMLAASDDSGGRAVIIDYLPHDDHNKLDEICSELRRKGYVVHPLVYDRHSPAGFDVRLEAVLSNAKAEALCIDVSGLSRLAIMLVLDVARDLNLPLRILYSEAKSYAPTYEEFSEARNKQEQHLPTSFIDTGFYDVLRVERLSSTRMQNHATLLIAFDSFNEALCQALVNVINPARFILINGRPPRDELRWREEATAYVHHRLRDEWAGDGDNDPVKTTSTLHYEQTQALLTELYWSFSGSHRIILAPTGSKMQTVGAYLLRAVHDDVHIEYPTVAGFFADKYSKGVRETWELDFGKMGDFVAELRRKDISEHLGLPEEPVNVDVD